MNSEKIQEVFEFFPNGFDPREIKPPKPKIEPYAPCPCGSGNKFKFCCYKTKNK